MDKHEKRVSLGFAILQAIIALFQLIKGTK
jgi:hypothetical protein